MEQEIKIGDKFFIFDINRRVYERDENGRAVGGATFRGHFAPVKIVDETSRSWVLDRFGVKVSKKDPFSVLFTEEMIDEKEWVEKHAYRVVEKIRYMKDAEKLKQIAKIVGYES